LAVCAIPPAASENSKIDISTTNLTPMFCAPGRPLCPRANWKPETLVNYSQPPSFLQSNQAFVHRFTQSTSPLPHASTQLSYWHWQRVMQSVAWEQSFAEDNAPLSARHPSYRWDWWRTPPLWPLLKLARFATHWSSPPKLSRPPTERPAFPARVFSLQESFFPFLSGQPLVAVNRTLIDRWPFPMTEKPRGRRR
jgi:hypothetical protein